MMRTKSASTPLFGEATDIFVKAGIPRRALLPIAPVDATISGTGDLDERVLGKAPGRYNARKRDWRGLGGGYLSTGVKDPKDQDEFASWPTPNVGLLGRFAPAIDSDAETEDARRLVEDVLIDVFGRNAGIAERLRGDGPRRLYAFLALAPGDETRVVRTRHIVYRMAGEDERDTPHKIDVIGYGGQYLIAGEHQSGDRYRWASEFDLADMHERRELIKIDNADIARFMDAFAGELERLGGEILTSTGGRAPGEERDYSKEDPIFPVKDILDGLQDMPNDEDTFPTRDEFVSVVSAIRAALGAEAEENRDHVEAWACENPDWCPAEYFDKVWNSTSRSVRVDRFALDRRFRAPNRTV